MEPAKLLTRGILGIAIVNSLLLVAITLISFHLKTAGQPLMVGVIAIVVVTGISVGVLFWRVARQVSATSKGEPRTDDPKKKTSLIQLALYPAVTTALLVFKLSTDQNLSVASRIEAVAIWFFVSAPFVALILIVRRSRRKATS